MFNHEPVVEQTAPSVCYRHKHEISASLLLPRPFFAVFVCILVLLSHPIAHGMACYDAVAMSAYVTASGWLTCIDRSGAPASPEADVPRNSSVATAAWARHLPATLCVAVERHQMLFPSHHGLRLQDPGGEHHPPSGNLYITSHSSPNQLLSSVTSTNTFTVNSNSPQLLRSS